MDSFREQFEALGYLQIEQGKAGDGLRRALGALLRKPVPWTTEDWAEACRIRTALGEVMKPYLETNRQMQALLPMMAIPNPPVTR